MNALKDEMCKIESDLNNANKQVDEAYSSRVKKEEKFWTGSAQKLNNGQRKRQKQIEFIHCLRDWTDQCKAENSALLEVTGLLINYVKSMQKFQYLSENNELLPY